ncbi:MAG: S9 family peptidase [Deltaproteobacteria bacterium]|nr:MAG: S9 family peptidase [Deltaproteobacteria bacterium]
MLVILPACGEKSPPAAAAATTPAFQYPEARRADVVDDYHGTPVADPYRWLEDPDSPETRAWIEAENALTRSYIDAVPQRRAILDRLHALWNYERFGVPFHQNGRYFWKRNDGLQDQSVLYVADGLDAEPRVLLDPNTWSDDGTVALASYGVSEDARIIAYGRSDGGSDWVTWSFKDIDTGEDLPDTLAWTKFSGVSWAHDGSGVFYSRYPTPTQQLQDVNEDNRLQFHALGTDQSEDIVVFEDPEHPRRSFSGTVTRDGELLVITSSEGTEEKSRVYIKDLTGDWRDDAPGEGVIPLLTEYDAGYYFIARDGDRLLFWTNKDAPRGRVVALDIDGVEGPVDSDALIEVVPQRDAVLSSANRVGDHLVLVWQVDAHDEVEVTDLSGQHQRDVDLPGIGSVWGFAGDPDRDETFFAFTGFTDPTTIFRYDVGTGERTLFKRPDVDFNPDDYVTRQVFYTSADGTRVPMFITHRKGIELDGSNPTILYGYGGFNISLTPWFSVTNQVWMEMGGVFAVANLRGGGEYGEEWHQAGTLANKQNVFDDFYAAAHYLIDHGYTRTDKLAIQGGSNGGLLVGAAITQHPELFGAALPAVGVMDMLRYHKFTIGWAWASDYGTSDDPEQFQTLIRYSPVHNTRPGTHYPATLITTGDHDDRVVPAHSFKFAAALQHDQGGPAPVLIRIETRAGHGRGKPTSLVMEEKADIFAFLVRALDMHPTAPWLEPAE